MAESTNFSTVSQLSAQWSNPSDVLSLLLIIGGDIVQTALAQTTGSTITPVCFSFGWVAYSFSAIVRALGEGRLLPEPDYPVKVFNLESSYGRENKNWVIGRILRDNEVFMNKIARHDGAGIRISIYRALDPLPGSNIIIYFADIFWALVTIIQIGIAGIPMALYGDWGVFLITCSGIVAAILAGALPQWRLEKMPLKRKSEKCIALTSGNGSRDIMIIYGAGVALDLEELAAAESPRSDRAWEAFKMFSQSNTDENSRRRYHRSGNEFRKSLMYNGLPVGLWITRIACFCQAVFWLALLITVAGLTSHSWYLVAVGSLGMLQNAMVAAVARTPDRRGLPLDLVDFILAYRTMDGLMDLESTVAGTGIPLLDEFFPGSLREDELAWWSGAREEYDSKPQLYRRASTWEPSVMGGGTAEYGSMVPSPQIPQDLKGFSYVPAKSVQDSIEKPLISRQPARNDFTARHSEESVKSPDWA
ncbi:hypothetical protein K469DRAFT_733075 [Zopfia rhizophila CBS 207.26]|uniref:Uncharacterized protein n=1 Tax=Zopfia rhizophila CBS 207.26 TaxID=1314779 RepID=A0A6A6DGP2_9PEZI|nr:hypothetical protein K469DRAFT_733075 [Zopfia rhizophila CBS 207.26]